MKTRFHILGILGVVLLAAAASVQAQVGGQRPEKQADRDLHGACLQRADRPERDRRDCHQPLVHRWREGGPEVGPRGGGVAGDGSGDAEHAPGRLHQDGGVGDGRRPHVRPLQHAAGRDPAGGRRDQPTHLGGGFRLRRARRRNTTCRSSKCGGRRANRRARARWCSPPRLRSRTERWASRTTWVSRPFSGTSSRRPRSPRFRFFSAGLPAGESGRFAFRGTSTRLLRSWKARFHACRSSMPSG